MKLLTFLSFGQQEFLKKKTTPANPNMQIWHLEVKPTTGIYNLTIDSQSSEIPTYFEAPFPISSASQFQNVKGDWP